MRNPARISVGVSLVLLLGATIPGLAQTYPDKPLRLFSGFPPGAPIDSLTRQIGAGLTRSWGQACSRRL